MIEPSEKEKELENKIWELNRELNIEKRERYKKEAQNLIGKYFRVYEEDGEEESIYERTGVIFYYITGIGALDSLVGYKFIISRKHLELFHKEQLLPSPDYFNRQSSEDDVVEISQEEFNHILNKRLDELGLQPKEETK